MTDFETYNAGSVFLLRAVSAEAQDWVEQHIPADAIRWGGAVVIEANFVPPVLIGIEDDGLTINEEGE